jgi:hypothetical protein
MSTLLAVLLSMTPVFAQTAPSRPLLPPPQTFELTPDGRCSLKSDALLVAFNGQSVKNVITSYNTW